MDQCKLLHKKIENANHKKKSSSTRTNTTTWRPIGYALHVQRVDPYRLTHCPTAAATTDNGNQSIIDIDVAFVVITFISIVVVVVVSVGRF